MLCHICNNDIGVNEPRAWILKPRTYKPAHRRCTVNGLVVPSPYIAKTQIFVIMPSRRRCRDSGTVKYQRRYKFRGAI